MYEFVAFELLVLTRRSSAILVVNRRTATRADLKTILRTHVMNLVVPKIVLVVEVVVVVKN